MLTHLRHLLEEDDPNVAGALQWSLSRSVDDAMPHLIQALQSTDERARHRALAAVIKMKPADSQPVLRQALHHSDHFIRDWMTIK